MISFSVRNKQNRSLRVFFASLWFLGILLLPAILLALPVLVIGCLVIRVNPLRMMSVLGGILAGLKGTNVEVEDRYRTYTVQVA